MRFEGNLEASDDSLRGWATVEDFMARRTELVLATPDLARVVFVEELFQSAPEVAQLLRGMMHRHCQELLRHFQEAVDAGEIRGDIPPDTLFRMVIGPLRLLIKQWGRQRGVRFDGAASGAAGQLEEVACETITWSGLEPLPNHNPQEEMPWRTRCSAFNARRPQTARDVPSAASAGRSRRLPRCKTCSSM